MVRRQQVSRGGFVGIGALACLLFLDLAIVTFAPWWTAVPLVVLWLLLIVMAGASWVVHPRRPVWFAAFGFVVWVLAVVLVVLTS